MYKYIYIYIFNWICIGSITAHICVFVFSKFERVFKKNVHKIVVQSIAQLKLYNLLSFWKLVDSTPKRTASAWRKKINQSKI